MDRGETRAGVIPVDNETRSSAKRTTLEDKTITYRLKVLQQPARARACGQGAKSSADRRPVDPPPIVELKIFEGEHAENDITFSMHANYFLFATLEQARSIAHGRVGGDRQIPCVLTGTPVAGMVYLDRPNPAGYFIFPDLSVRHEGKYRLSFSLYEELKSAKDDDKSSDPSRSSPSGDAHVTHRLDVKSEPFMVFSAKKFPGLTESTTLSRMVAEQGCRVRIRRDVRMRRRDTKGSGKDWEGYEEETAQNRARMSGTPDPNIYPNLPTPHGFMDPTNRPRSTSLISHHSFPSSVVSRRTSLQDIGQPYNQSHFGAPPHTPQSGYTQTSPYGPSPGSYPHNGFIQQPSGMQPPPPAYGMPAMPQPNSYYGYAPPAPPGPVSPSQYGVSSGYEAAPQQNRLSDYSSQTHHDYRRSSTQLGAPPAPQPPNGYVHATPAPSYSLSSQQTYQQTMAPAQHSLAPAHPGAPPPSFPTTMDVQNPRPAPVEPMPSRAAGASAPMSGRPSLDLPPLNTSVMSSNRIEASSPSSSSAINSYYSSAQTSMDSHKRSYGNVFNDRHQDQPLRHGARPTSTYDGSAHGTSGLSAVDDDDKPGIDLGSEMMGMQYRRADGRQICRSLPSHS